MMVDQVVDHEPLAIMALFNTCMKNAIADERAQHNRELATEKQRTTVAEGKCVSGMVL